MNYFNATIEFNNSEMQRSIATLIHKQDRRSCRIEVTLDDEYNTLVTSPVPLDEHRCPAEKEIVQQV